jgi:autotransporter-associated beta strand protein
MFASKTHHFVRVARTETLKSGGMALLFFAVLFSLALPFNCPAQIYKTNNNDALNLGTSWAGVVAPGSGNVAAWDATVATPANCTNVLSGSVSWGGILILNPAAAVKLLTNNNPTISIGSSGINLSNATANLWVAPALTTVADQKWTITNGLTLTLGEAGRNVTIANNVTINGNVLFPNVITINSGRSLNIPSGTTLTSTITNNAVTAITVNGTVNQTGGIVTVGRSDSTSGSPKTTLTIGSSSAGTYNLGGGSLVDGSTTSDGRVDVGTGVSAPGTLNVSGNALLQLQALYVANGGDGTVNITNGTVIVANNFRVGVSAGTGTMNVYGGTVQSGSTMNLPNGPGTGFLNLNGGTVNINAISLATSSGGSGSGTLNVNGGLLNVTNSIALAPSTGNGTLNLNGGTSLVSSMTRSGSGVATMNWNGGLLKPSGNNPSFIASGINLNVGTNGALIDTTNFNITILPPLLNGTGGVDGGLVKSGGGILTLAGTNTYNGPTIVSAGTLLANNPNSIAASTNIVVAAGATLNISGSGVIAVHAGPTLAGTLIMQVSKNGATPVSDNLAFAGGTINFDGVLTVTLSGNLPVVGDTFDLFDASSFTGRFTTINLPALTNGLSWDTSGLTVDGSIKVITNNASPFIPAVFNSIVLQGGTNMIISGSGGASNGVYFVLSSTNMALPWTNWTMTGGSNWFDGNGNFNFTNVVSHQYPAQFFALSLSPQILSAADFIILQALQNMRDEGFNAYLTNSGSAEGPNSPGGLWVNWYYTNNPPVNQSMGNINFDGTPDPDPTTRHDRLTDIDYLAALCLYKKLHPLDPQFDAEINRYTNICQSPANDNLLASPDQRGWVYWAIEDITSVIQSYSSLKNAQADKYYNLYTNHFARYGQTMPLYWSTPADELSGTYRGDLLVEDACVLIVNGHERNLTNYVVAGENLMTYAQSNTYSAKLQLWADTMGHLFTDTNRTAVAPASQQYIYDATVNTSEIGEILDAICRAEAADPGKGYGTLALATLNKLVPATNSFGLWDTTHGGYYSNLILNGTNIQSAGLTASVNTSYKQVGRATVMIQAYLSANIFAGGNYGTNTLVAINNANLNSYYAAGHGWPFQENNDYSIYLDHVGNQYVPQTWVTSEAISHAARALLTARIQGIAP